MMRFESRLEENIFQLHRELTRQTYRHGPYRGFWICDPKSRHIHKATVRDRVLHHAVFRILNLVFDPTFIPTSFSCRLGRGTHRGVKSVEKMLRQTSRNYNRPGYVLKCDIEKFFESVNHAVLLEILGRKIKDPNAMWLLRTIIESYPRVYERERERERESKNAGEIGIPIGNLTSQLFANIYLNEFDQFVKHELKARNYARYTDDFVIVSEDKNYLNNLLPPIQSFLWQELKLKLHPHKVAIRKLRQGIDFLGYVILPHHLILRPRTRKRMFRRLTQKMEDYQNRFFSEAGLQASILSYLGMLSHCQGYILSKELKNYFWISSPRSRGVLN
ncbi:MAG: RNA-dependent DNA polymerase [Candidatus Vogelbacteria bacterium]|nr:RNA-dependent DNA polymerase [Candidatus Vogelbacteria bacterium]